MNILYITLLMIVFQTIADQHESDVAPVPSDRPAPKRSHTVSAVADTELGHQDSSNNSNSRNNRNGKNGNNSKKKMVDGDAAYVEPVGRDGQKHGRRAGFTEEHTRLLKSWFPSHTPTTPTTVDTWRRSNPELAAHVSDFTSKQLADKVRSMYRSKT
jgi:hypothetical protein